MEDHTADPSHGRLRPDQQVMDGENSIVWIDWLTGVTAFKRNGLELSLTDKQGARVIKELRA